MTDYRTKPPQRMEMVETRLKTPKERAKEFADLMNVGKAVCLDKFIEEDRQAHCDELMRLIESEIEILEQVIEKTKEYVAVGHKKVYEAIKIISEYKGKLEGYKDVLTIVKEVYKSNN